jgi:serine protease Do
MLKKLSAFFVPLLISAAAVSGAALAATAPADTGVANAPHAKAAAQSLPDFTGIVSEFSTAVVNVSAKQPRGAGFDFRNHPLWPMIPPELRRRFPRGGDDAPPRFALPVQGSGFVIDPGGYVLTNYHVVAEAEEVMVNFSDGRKLEAEVVGLDRQTDIALLKVESDTPLAAVKIGDSENLAVGEWVLAIGSPFGFDQTVTAGIVGAISRRLPRENFVPFIQTDAAINPGNSGGPLINLSGEVVGINSQIYTRTGTYAGVSFAIPINIAMEVQGQLRDGGRVRRGRLGVMFKPVDESIAHSFGMADSQGALIDDLVDDSAAEKAGLRSGDIILRFAGTEVKDGEDLPNIVGARRPGDEVDIVVWRDAQRVTVTAVLDEFLPGDDGAVALAGGDSVAKKLGLVLENLDRRRSRELGVESGVVIAGFRFTDKTPVEVQKLRRGDVITGVVAEGRVYEIDNRADFNRYTEKAGGTVVTFQVVRNSARTFITINLEE